MKKRRKNTKRRLRKLRNLGILILPLILLIISGIGILQFHNTHYRRGTVIAGIDCSSLTVEQAAEKINSYISDENICFNFPNEVYVFNAKDINLHLSNASALKEILTKQNNGDKSKTYELPNAFFCDSLTSIFYDIKSLQKDFIAEPENACLVLTDSNLLEIVPGKSGVKINFDDAYSFAYNKLTSGITTIDFSEISIFESPEINSLSLQSQKVEINKVLSTIINIKLIDGTTITLDNAVTKDWLVQDDLGNYSIDIENNLPIFVESLSERIDLTSSSDLSFNATDFGLVNVSIPKKNRMNLNSKKELEQLSSELQSGKIINRSPIYNNIFSLDSYVEIDVSRQKVWMYYNGECIVETDCVTGNAKNHNTPSGLFYLTYKTTDDYLEGYNDNGTRYKSFVNYWMPFNGGIGMHDASWRRGKFGGTIYKTNGSHGCINLPFDAAKIIYNHIDSSMPIIVYESGT